MSEGINEFLDNALADAPADSAPAAEAPPAEAAPPAEPAEAVDTDVDLDAEPEGETFDRAYVERIRKEAAKYRTRAKQFEDAFDGYGDDEREGLFNLARTLRQDPRQAAQEMAAAAEEILKQYNEPEPGSDDDPESKFMTMADYQRIQEEQAIAAEQRNIESEARELGYKVDPKDVDYRLLLLTAQNLDSGSLKEAHEIIQKREQAAIDRYLASKASDAEGAKAPAESAQIPSNSEPIRDFKQARTALEAFIAQQRGAF